MSVVWPIMIFTWWLPEGRKWWRNPSASLCMVSGSKRRRTHWDMNRYTSGAFIVADTVSLWALLVKEIHVQAGFARSHNLGGRNATVLLVLSHLACGALTRRAHIRSRRTRSGKVHGVTRLVTAPSDSTQRYNCDREVIRQPGELEQGSRRCLRGPLDRKQLLWLVMRDCHPGILRWTSRSHLWGTRTRRWSSWRNRCNPTRRLTRSYLREEFWSCWNREWSRWWGGGCWRSWI